MLVQQGGGGFACMACGVDLWDVPRHIRAGNVIVCEGCLEVMSEALGRGTASGRIEVAIPPKVSGSVPDGDAVASVVDSFLRTFGAATERSDEVMEDAEELRPLLDQAGRMFGANLDPKTVVDRVRFPDPDTAEVRFRVLLRGSPDGMRFEGKAVRRSGHWLVTRDTVVSVLPGGFASGATFVRGSTGTARRTLERFQRAGDEDHDDTEPPEPAG